MVRGYSTPSYTHSVYCRHLCFVTFTNVSCVFLSSARTDKWHGYLGYLCSFPKETPSLPGIPFVHGLPFNDRLQTHQTTLKSFHTLIPNRVSNQLHVNFHVNMQHTLLQSSNMKHTLLQTSNTVYIKKCPVLQLKPGQKFSRLFPLI